MKQLQNHLENNPELVDIIEQNTIEYIKFCEHCWSWHTWYEDCKGHYFNPSRNYLTNS